MNEALRIVVIAPDLNVLDPQDHIALLQAERSRALRIGLLENGYNLVASLPADVFLTERLAQLQPDMVIVDAESEARDALEHVVVATRHARRPIVMFTNDNDTSHVKDAVAAGVSAYTLAGLSAARIRTILDVGISPALRALVYAAGSDKPEKEEVKIGFILLTDCASVVMASVLGIDKKYGVKIIPSKEASWAGVRDKMVNGELDFAHALYGLVYGVHMGESGPKKDMAVPMTLNQNGQAITLSKKLADKGVVDGTGLAKLMSTEKRPAG